MGRQRLILQLDIRRIRSGNPWPAVPNKCSCPDGECFEPEVIVAVATRRRFTPFYFYLGVVLCLGFVVARAGFFSWSIVPLLTVGVISWGLFEYGMHRFIFHYDARSRLGRKFLYHAHVSHHENPRGKNRVPASLFLAAPIGAGYWLLAWAATGSWAAASWSFIGLAAGYFSYKWVHFQCHHRRSRLRLLRYLRHYHLLHHHKTPALRFGVTSPLFDLAFGTFRAPSPRPSFSRSQRGLKNG
jgi:sterol desaturase/sphingolipid hydroxylase (fatty acid hydroxylase superfamily)